MSKRLQFLLGAIFFTLLLIYAGGLFYSKLGVLQMRSDPGWMPVKMGGRVFVGQITGGDNSAIQTYDEVIALNGQALSTYEQFTTLFLQAEPGSRDTLIFRRGNQLH